MAAITEKKFYQGRPSNTETTLFTATKRTLIKEIILANTTASDATITLSVVSAGQAAGADNRILSAKRVFSNDVIVMALSTPLAIGDFLSGLQGTTGGVSVTVSGVEIV